MTFLNEQSCVQAASCSPLTFGTASFELTASLLNSWYTESSMLVYYITGLRLESPYDVSPCDAASRWLKWSGACDAETTFTDTVTKDTIVAALTASIDTNAYVRDIDLSTATDCSDSAALGAK